MYKRTTVSVSVLFRLLSILIFNWYFAGLLLDIVSVLIYSQWLHAKFVTAIFILQTYALYKLAVRPFDRRYTRHDFGFVFEEYETTSTLKEAKIRRIRELKRNNENRELPPAFGNGWYAVLESEQLQPGSIKDIFVLGRQLLAVRAMDKSVYVTNPTCLHMGANFSSGGRVVDNNKIQCPFHGWKWDAATGKLFDIPYSHSDCGKINAKLGTWPVLERNKHIYLWYHADGEQPTWEPETFEKIESGEWVASGRSQHEVLCHQQEIPENGADLAHLNFLHRIGANEGSDIINEIDLSLENVFQVTHTWNGEWFSLDDQKHIGVMHLKQFMQFMGWAIPYSDSFLRAEQVGPGIVHMKFKFAFGEAICLHHVTPIEPLLQKATFKFYANINAAFCKFFMYSETSQFERDVLIWSNKTFVKNPLLASADGPINKFRSWFKKQFYIDSSPIILPCGNASDQPKKLLDF